MFMADDRIEDQIREWLHRNGYVLEMQVARRIIAQRDRVPRSAYLVEQSVQYKDVMTEKLRESDVHWNIGDTQDLAPGARPHSARIVSVIECKNTSAPWILFLESTWDEFHPSKSGFDDCADCQRIRRVYVGASYKLPWARDAPAYAVMEKKTRGERDHAREAVLSAVSATLGLVADESKEAYRTHSAALYIPVVVTSSPLYTCQLDGDGDVELVEVRSCSVPVSHEAEDAPISVRVVGADAFDDYVTAICDLYNAARRDAFEGESSNGAV